MLIKSSAALRDDYDSISKLAHETGEPIYITENGEGKLVLMNSESFEQMRQQIAFEAAREAVASLGQIDGAPDRLNLNKMTDAERKHKLRKGYTDLANGNVYEARAAFSEFRKRHGL